MIEYLKESQTALFAYHWESHKPWNIAQNIGRKAKSHLKDVGREQLVKHARSNFQIKKALSAGGVLAAAATFGPVDVILGCVALTEVFMNMFKDGKKNAKLAGQLLGYTLAMRRPFLTQSVSLIGFSLGTQVIKSCLKTLHALGASQIIHNVTFMGGAIDRLDRAKTRHLWTSVLSTVVAGEIKNVRTKKDLILILYSICETTESQGRNDIFNSQFVEARRTNLLADRERSLELPAVAQVGDTAFRLRNFDLWSLPSKNLIGIGHLQYRDYLTLILRYIQFRI